MQLPYHLHLHVLHLDHAAKGSLAEGGQNFVCKQNRKREAKRSLVFRYLDANRAANDAIINYDYMDWGKAVGGGQEGK